MNERQQKPGRIGRPPKVDEFGRPTRDRLLEAAVAACVEHGYEGVTLSDIAGRADVSTAAVYSHFPGKAALLVEASKRELAKISSGELVKSSSLRELVRRWLEPDFSASRILVAEIHCAAIRQPEVAQLLGEWRGLANKELERAGLTPAQMKMFYVLLIGASHVDEVNMSSVTKQQTAAEMDVLVSGWLEAGAD